MRSLRIVKGVRPLYFHDGRLYCSKYDRILVTDDFGETFDFIAKIDIPTRLAPIIGMSQSVQRVLRMGVYRLRILDDGDIVFSYKSGVYRIENGQTRAERTYAVRAGSRPVSLAYAPGGMIVFGEYFDNADRAEMHVFGSRDHGRTWNPVHTFSAGSIRHIHGITYDPHLDCFWIATGDVGNENKVLRADSEFADVQIVREGGQGNRFYSFLVDNDNLIAATDTPLESNFISVIDKFNGTLEEVQPIENSNFYSCRVGDRFFVSTNAEPSEVNDIDSSHLWMSGQDYRHWNKVASYPVDWLAKLDRLPVVPPGLFQFSRIFFPEGTNDSSTLVVHAIGLRGLSNHMICYDIEDFIKSDVRDKPLI